MKTKRVLLGLGWLWALSVVALGHAGAAETPTVEELVEENLAARGGKARILAVRSARLTGTLSMGRGQAAPMRLEWRRPDRLRVEFESMGLTGIQAYDGATAWVLLPFHGQTEPEALTDDARAPLVDAADFDGALVDYGGKGHTLSLLGTEAVDGRPAYKLGLERRNGRVSTLFLDAGTFLVVKSVDFGPGGEEVESTVSDYRSFDGLLLACARERKPKGAAGPGQVTRFTKVELDVDLPDSRFAMPR